MGTSVTITKVEGKLDLFAHYTGEYQPQDVFIALDADEGRLWADYNAEIGNAVPSSVWHGHVKRWGVPLISASTANDLMERLIPLATRIIKGYTSKWNGSNEVACYTDDAETAIEEVERICSEVEADFGYSDACDWINYPAAGLTADMTDDQLEKEASDVVDYALDEGLILDLGDVYSLFQRARDDLIEESEAE